ncbi:MAG: hypothetical protein ACLRFL_02940 [Clostridia bacterium]
MTPDEITFLNTYYYNYLAPIMRKDFLISQNQKHIEDTNIQLSQIKANIKALEKTLTDTKTQHKAEMSNLLVQLFQEYDAVLEKVYFDQWISIKFGFLGKNYIIYNQMLSWTDPKKAIVMSPISKNIPITFEDNYADQFIEHHSEMKYSDEFGKLIKILILVDNNPKARDIIVDREMNKKKDELAKLYNKVLDIKLLAEQHLHILKDRTPNNKITSKLLELEKQISVHTLESEKIKTRLDNLESERPHFEKIVDTNISQLRAIVEFTEKIQEMQVKLNEKTDQIRREYSHVIRLENNMSIYEKDIKSLDEERDDLLVKLNIFLASNYTEPILIRALDNANEEDLAHDMYLHIDELRKRYNDFVTEKIDNLLD